MTLSNNRRSEGMTPEKQQADKIPRKRLGRNDWLAMALELLSEYGGAEISVRDICRRMGTSTGSFYWHFSDLRDFTHSLVKYWVDTLTASPINEVKALQCSPRDRLLALMTMITESGLARYDIPIRVLAAKDAKVAELVKIGDELRLQFVRQLFADIGFDDKELEMRVRTFVVFHSMEPAIQSHLSISERLELMKLRFEWFIDSAPKTVSD
jgi:AcrR family transcriptional regulator